MVLYWVCMVWLVWTHGSYCGFDFFNLRYVSSAMFGVLWLFFYFSYYNSRTSPVFRGLSTLVRVCMAFPNPARHGSRSAVFVTTPPLTRGAHSQDPHIRPNPTFWASSLAGCPQNHCPLRSEYDSTSYLYKPGYSLAIGLLEPRWGLRQEPGIWSLPPLTHCRHCVLIETYLRSGGDDKLLVTVPTGEQREVEKT